MPHDAADDRTDRDVEGAAPAVDAGACAAGDVDAADGSAVADDRAVLDRVVDGVTAVLLVGPAGDELLLPADHLPSDATDGTWLVLDLAVDPPTVVRVDRELTAARAARASERMERLRRTRRGGRFDR